MTERKLRRDRKHKGSIDPLDERIMRAMEVFAGAPTAEAIAALCAPEEGEAVRKQLESLVDAGVLRWENSFDWARFSRQDESFKPAPIAQREMAQLCKSHLIYFTELAEEIDRRIDRGPRGVWFDRQDADYEDYKSALLWSREDAETHDLGLRLAGALWHYWYARGLYREGKAWLDEQRESASGAGRTSGRAKALFGNGILSWLVGDYQESRQLLEESVGIARELDRPTFLAAILTLLGLAQMSPKGDYDSAIQTYEQAVAIYRHLDDTWGKAWSLYHLALVFEVRDDLETARAIYHHSLTLFNKIDDHADSARPLLGLGTLDYKEGNFEAAYEALELALTRRKRTQDIGPISSIALLLGEGARCCGESQRAALVFREALPLLEQLDNRRGQARCQLHLGRIALENGETKAATDQLAMSLAAYRELDDEQGLALSLLAHAELALEANLAEQGARLLGAAIASLAAIGGPSAPVDRRDLQATKNRAQGALSTEELEAALEAGGALSVEAAIQEAVDVRG